MLTFELNKMTAVELRALMNREGVDMVRAEKLARPIVDDVRANGDEAVLRYSRKLDGFKGSSLTVSNSQLVAAKKRTREELLRAMRAAKRRISTFHSRQRIDPFEYVDECGVFGQRVVPLKRVGVYVPGGSADYISTVLMACVPARIAGVEEIAICTPGRNGSVPDSILIAVDICGVDEVHPIGGAQAIAAMAYGTKSIPRVQKIVGPGGAVVTAAKLLVRNDCEIDFLAGPSEIMVIADARADSVLIASDMVAQLEHDPLARAVLVTNSKRTAKRVREELARMISRSARRTTASTAADKGAIFIVTPTISDALDLSNEFAPEHLLLDTEDPAKLADRIESAGSVFIGSCSSVAFGDYCSGTNHILPTKGAASMKSSLSVYDFLKIIPYQSISPNGVRKLAPIADVLARSEGLPAHAEAAMMRARRLSK